MTKRRTQPKYLLAVLALCLIGTAALTLGATVAKGGDTETAGLNDDGQILQVIQTYRLARFPAVPASDVGKSSLSPSTSQAMNEQYQAVLKEVATEAFIGGPRGQLDVAANVQQVCSADGITLVKQDTQVMGLENRGDAGDGNRIVWVRVWNGQGSRQIDADGKSGSVVYVDDAPIYEYVVQPTPDGWKIVSERVAVVSEDGDPTQYGPQTPHTDHVIRPEEDAPPKI